MPAPFAFLSETGNGPAGSPHRLGKERAKGRPVKLPLERSYQPRREKR
jgi:hypothetical protein